MSTQTRTLLTWQQGKYSSYAGSANGIPLFGITWKTRREDPDWLMRTELPGTRNGAGWKSDDLDELKATAEKVLRNWIARVTYRPQDQSATKEGQP